MNKKKQTDKMARELISVRLKKINRLKQKIHSGKYKVNNEELAKALFLSQ